MCLLNDTHSSSVIVKLKSIFSCFVIPKVVISDNGPQVSSYQFMRFAKEWDFMHDPWIPKHAKSNSMAEKCSENCQDLIQESASKQGGPIPCAHAHCSTPSSNENKSPYEKLFNQ